MNLTRYIKELLYQQECVTLPGFGAFLAQAVPIRVDYQTGDFSPPKKEISFNALIQKNDGLLANYVALKENLNYEKALALVERELETWRKQLETQLVILPGIGELSLNVENKVRFLPHGKINFDPNATGLKSFKRHPLRDQLQAAAVVPQKPQSSNTNSNSMDNTKKEPLSFTPEKQDQEGSSKLKVALIGIVAVSIIGASYYFGNQYLENERIKSTELAQKRIAKNVQEATFDLGAIASLELSVPADVETTSDSTNDVQYDRGQFYSVIAGSFRDQANAERKLNKLKAEGFESAAYAEPSADGLYRVAYGRYTSKREAYRMLSFVTNSLEEEAWYLVEGN